MTLDRTIARRAACALVLVISLALASSASGFAVRARIDVDVSISGPPARTITYVGATYDRPDLPQLGVGRAGSWFPRFASPSPVSGRPTGEGARPNLPSWIAPFNHTTGPADPGCDAAGLLVGCTPGYLFRTFSQDGPARSAGGHAGWSTLTLPDGTTGSSGAIVDPQTRANTNNTINRIQLRTGTPASFLVHVLTDNTALQFDPAGLLVARGNIGPADSDLQIEPGTHPGPDQLVFNGVPDVYTFRFDGFVAGDYVKLRLNGGPASVGGASFGGLLFDVP